MASIFNFLQSKWLRLGCLITVVFAALAIMSPFKVGQILENHALDLCYRLRPFSL